LRARNSFTNSETIGMFRRSGNNRDASNDQCVSCMKDTEYGCRSHYHIRTWAVRDAFTAVAPAGHRSKAYRIHFHGKGFKMGHRSRAQVDDVDVVKMRKRIVAKCAVAVRWTGP
jgi:hypothetical protein